MSLIARQLVRDVLIQPLRLGVRGGRFRGNAAIDVGPCRGARVENEVTRTSRAVHVMSGRLACIARAVKLSNPMLRATGRDETRVPIRTLYGALLSSWHVN
ncbi:hypothetical protein P3T76_010909 [Phytophthora citrophthora]|uniref:Uncharacterized protein n=1 Tax=Phytophthora citrophthora TaxID=4793 RepID=A0AAD9GAW2_9STRA|nr:hypothetical protein P3T76_010909 [Phytophthora citrophthora]